MSPRNFLNTYVYTYFSFMFLSFFFFFFLFLLYLVDKFAGQYASLQPPTGRLFTNHSLPWLLNVDGLTINRTCIMSRYRFLMEDLHCFWRKICISLCRESADHQGFGWAETQFTNNSFIPCNYTRNVNVINKKNCKLRY